MASYSITLQSPDGTENKFECADEWVAKGHKISSGVVKYYDAYYNK